MEQNIVTASKPIKIPAASSPSWVAIVPDLPPFIGTPTSRTVACEFGDF